MLRATEGFGLGRRGRRAHYRTSGATFCLLAAISGCAPSQQPSSPAGRRAQLEGDLAVIQLQIQQSELKIQQSDRTMLNDWQDRCDQAMAGLRAHRDDGRISDVRWLGIQESERAIRESLSVGHAANGRGNSAEVLRQISFISARVDELEDLEIKLAREAGEE